MLSRRDLLASTAAVVTLAVPRFTTGALAQDKAAAALGPLLDVFFQENLEENPEGATQLGMDKGANAALK